MCIPRIVSSGFPLIPWILRKVEILILNGFENVSHVIAKLASLRAKNDQSILLLFFYITGGV